MSNALPAYDFDLSPRVPRTVRPRRARSVSSAHRRRSEEVAVHPLQKFWDEHAIKAGIVSFWLWFGAANWSKFEQIGATVWAGFFG